MRYTEEMIPFMEWVKGFRDTLTSTFGVRINEWAVFTLGAVMLFTALVFMPDVVTLALSIALFLAPLWLPFLLVPGALKLWLIFRQGEFIASQKYILLEIKPPRSVAKTPLAMETFLSTLHLAPGEGTWYVRWIKGSVRPWWSLEIASFEGQVHFFIWTRAGYRRIVESQLYAQYPGVQIVETPDYTRFISADQDEGWSIWGCDFKHSSPAPLPIKTYVEYGLDKVQKEYEQVDPLANLVEFMGSIGRGEYLWLQFIIRVHKGERYNKKNKKGKTYTWKDEAQDLIEQLRLDTVITIEEPGGTTRQAFPNPTEGQKAKIASIERNISKQGFDVGARAVYIARSEHFNPAAITQMNGLFKPFSTEGWNDISASAWLRRFDDYPWEVNPGRLKKEYAKRLVEAFRRRQFFYEPVYYGVPPNEAMVMSTEELATVFHIPSQSVETPGLGRVPSATSEAPPNLPI